MTTLRDIITDAYREGGIVQIGDTPEAEELDEGLRRLKAYIHSLFGYELGDDLTPVTYGTYSGGNAYANYWDEAPLINSYFVPDNTRLEVTITAPSEVYLNPRPQDGARLAVVDVRGNFSTNNLTINANGRKIEGADTVVLNTDRATKEWFYRADLGEWKLVDTYTANSESPFPTKYDPFLSIGLAFRLNPRYKDQTAPESMEDFQRLKNMFQAQYRQKKETRTEIGLLRLSGSDNYIYDYSLYPGSTESSFNRGFIG